MLWCYSSGLVEKYVVRREPVLRIPHGAKLSYFRSFSELWSCRFAACSAELNLLQRVCRSGAVIFDIGANVGYYTTIIGRLCPDSAIFAFEPSPATREILQRNIRLNGLRSVHLSGLALADRDGYCGFADDGASPATNHLILSASDGLRTSPSLKIPTTSLDNFITAKGIDRIDFAKIDVEGAEVLFVRGSRRILAERRLRLGLIELCPANLNQRGFSVEDLFHEVSSLGYVLRQLRDDGTAGVRYAPRKIPPDALYNAVLVPDRE